MPEPREHPLQQPFGLNGAPVVRVQALGELTLEVGNGDLAALERMHRVARRLVAVRRPEPLPHHAAEQGDVNFVVLAPRRHGVLKRAGEHAAVVDDERAKLGHAQSCRRRPMSAAYEAGLTTTRTGRATALPARTPSTEVAARSGYASANEIGTRMSG